MRETPAQGNVSVKTAGTVFFALCIFFHGVFLRGESLPSPEISPNSQRDFFISANGDLPIREIRIDGLTNTRESFIRSFVIVKPGDKLSGFDADSVEQNLRARGIFEEITFNYLLEEKEVIVIILIREKHTFIPLPFFKYSDNETSVGVFIFESNLFGINKIVYAGGYYSFGSGWYMMGGYNDPGIGGSHAVMYLHASGGKEIFENGDAGENIYQKYKAARVNVSCGPGYRITERSTLYVTLTYGLALIDEDYNEQKRPPAEGSFLRPGVRYIYKNLVYGKDLSYGTGFTAEYGTGFPITGNYTVHYHSNIRMSWQIPAFFNHRAGLLAFGSFSSVPVAFQERIGGTVARTLPSRKVASSRYISADAEYEIPFRIVSMLTFSFVSFWEGGVFRTSERDTEFFTGPGGGMRLYLKRVAIPAFGFNIAYNIPAKGTHVSVALGFQF